MSGLTPLALFKARAERSEEPIVVGDRVLTARWAVVLGLLLSASVISTQRLGEQMGQAQVPVHAFQPLIHDERTDALQHLQAPAQAYRVDILDQQTLDRITSVHMDPKDWPEHEQRRFLRKLVSQADQRAASQGRVFVIRALAVNGDDQLQAQAFVAQAMREVGIATSQTADATAQGMPGLRLERDPNDALGSSPCMVATGDLVGCLTAEAEAGSSPVTHRRRRAP